MPGQGTRRNMQAVAVAVQVNVNQAHGKEGEGEECRENEIVVLCRVERSLNQTVLGTGQHKTRRTAIVEDDLPSDARERERERASQVQCAIRIALHESHT